MYATLFICSANSVAFYLAQIEHMDALFEAQFSTLTDSGRILSKCGKCLSYMLAFMYMKKNATGDFCVLCLI